MEETFTIVPELNELGALPQDCSNSPAVNFFTLRTAFFFFQAFDKPRKGGAQVAFVPQSNSVGDNHPYQTVLGAAALDFCLFQGLGFYLLFFAQFLGNLESFVGGVLRANGEDGGCDCPGQKCRERQSASDGQCRIAPPPAPQL